VIAITSAEAGFSAHSPLMRRSFLGEINGEVVVIDALACALAAVALEFTRAYHDDDGARI
jgi:hypothetical protein